MTSLQKIIKYLAIAFAIFFIVSIISGILGVFYALSGVLGLKKENSNISGEMSTIEFENNNIETLDIDVAFTDLVIKKGDYLFAETNNGNINCKQNSQNLQIKEKSGNWISKNDKGDLIVYIPEDLEFEKVKINAGAGKITIDKLLTKNLDFELGAGETKIKSLDVSKSCNIEGGAGKLSIDSGSINNLDLDMGVGEVNLTSKLIGKSDIDAGIGNLNINLLGEKEDYRIDTDKGLGNIKIDSKEMADGQKFGDGENYIKIDGGVGNIKIDFKN